MESIEGITDFAKSLNIPCVGGKVSFYNETSAMVLSSQLH